MSDRQAFEHWARSSNWSEWALERFSEDDEPPGAILLIPRGSRMAKLANGIRAGAGRARAEERSVDDAKR